MHDKEQKGFSLFKSLLCLVWLLLTPFVQAKNTVLTLSVTPEINTIFPMLESSVLDAFKQLGIDVEFVEIPSARATKESQLGHFDGELIRMAEYDRYAANLIAVSVPYGAIEIKAYARKETTLNNYDDLLATTVATERGARFVSDIQAKFPFKTIEVLKWEQSLVMVSEGRVDVTLSTPVYAQLLMRKYKINNIEAKNLELGEVEFYLWLDKKHQAIADKLAPIFKMMKNDQQLGLF